ncbi:MAG TPA: four helix bundle protein [Pyrinomonadaceae bacterium]|nr:four helix bundle protein [Pyrinomonadaceae bacterium]
MEQQIKSHRDLIAWQKAMELVVCVYKLSKNFPKEEVYGLTSQLRRAAVSIPANIAEGQGRRSKTEFKQYLGHARGSLLEVDTHLELALRLEYIGLKDHASVQEQLREVGRIINGLMRSLTSNL